MIINKSTRFFLFSLILSYLLSICLPAQTVTGKLVDQNGNALSGLQLNLYVNPNVYTTVSNSNGVFTFNNVTGTTLPNGYGVSENYPNPFNPVTRLLVSLPADSRVNVKVLNILGQKVIKEIDRYFSAGTNPVDLELNGLPNGIYFARVNLDNKYTVVKKLMLIYGSQHLSSSSIGLSSLSGLNKSITGYNSTNDIKIDSLVVTGSSIDRKVYTNLPHLIGDIMDLGNLIIVPVVNIAYVHINPDWSSANEISYNNPRAILIGHEPFIYVCDTDNNRIVMLNTAGTVLGALGIKKPTAIAEDYRLNLIVCAEYDTVINGTLKTYSAVYKIDLFAVNHIIANASKKLILPRSVDFDHHPDVKYSAVTAFFDNSYYVARAGSNNSSIYDPDNAVISFRCDTQGEDIYESTLPFMDPLSSNFFTANGINSLTSFNKKNYDFIATFNKGIVNETPFKAQWFHGGETTTDSGGFKSGIDTSGGSPFVRPNRFGAPTGSCIDPFGNIYIADGYPGKDSVFKFDSYGNELQSFGGPDIFSKPAGVAFFDRTLYVLDSQKNMIRRFILSTDLGQ